MKHDVRLAVRTAAKRLLGMQNPRGGATTWDGYTRDALQLADIIDCSRSDLEQQQQHPERVDPDPARQSVNWYVPQFDNPYYGGMMTILRFAAHLQRRGMRQRFLVCGHADEARIAALIAEAFPELAQAEVIALDSAAKLDAIPASDFSFATLWTTAYVLLRVANTGLKFYFIQDYEPLFYPAGSTYAQAELTYRFGFFAIANTESIAQTYRAEYAGDAHTLRPCVDPAVFHDRDGERAARPLRLFYYARPGIPRNGFELAAAALRRLKRAMREEVDIVCAGAAWDPADYGLGGIVRLLGLLPYRETGTLYRSCHAGLVMMMTRHPSYLPFELMACGALVISNANAANRWFLRDGENCLLAPPAATALAETLERGLRNWGDYAGVRARATQVLAADHADWDAELGKAFDYVQSRTRLP